MTLMLNDRDETEIGADDDARERSSFTTLILQLFVIVVVGLYLLGMVVLYIQLPVIAVVVITIAAVILFASFFKSL